MNTDMLLTKEQNHLDRTVKPIKSKLKETKDELKDLEKKYKEGIKKLSEASHEVERGEIRGEIKGMLKSQMAEYKRDVLVKRLENQVNNPYFAKIEFNEENAIQTHYIGKFAFFSENQDLNIVDWRAPIASVYYNYTEPTKNAQYYVKTDKRDENVKGKLLSRVNFDIEQGKILAIYDNSLRVDLLKLRIKEKSGGKLTDIVETIQKTQNLIIREQPNNVCIVQGTAGSGKTTIAIHRLSYMLYTHKDEIKENNILLLSSSKVLINYVASTLPELDVIQVERNTLADFILDILTFNDINLPENSIVSPTKNYDSQEINSEQFINYLDTYINKRKLEILEDIQNEFFYEDLKLDNIFIRNINNPIFETCKEVNQNLEFRKNSLQSELKRGNYTVEDQFYDLEDATDYFNKLLKQSSVVNEFKNLIVNYNLEYKTNLSTKLDKLNVDILSIIYLLCKSLYGINLKNKTFKQVIVDEAQDLGLINYIVISSFSNNYGYTILGDLNQNTQSYGTIQSWDQIHNIFGPTNCSFYQINISYRTTVQIINLAKNVLKKFDAKHLPQAFEREGVKPDLKTYSSKKEIYKQIANIIKAKRESGDIRAVGIIEPDTVNITKTKEELEILGIKINFVKSNFVNFKESGNYLISKELVKGLEFDTVFVIDPNEKLVEYSKTGSKQMFVLLTRAINNLFVYSINKHNSLLE